MEEGILLLMFKLTTPLALEDEKLHFQLRQTNKKLKRTGRYIWINTHSHITHVCAI